jgi:hypothetical protein
MAPEGYGCHVIGTIAPGQDEALTWRWAHPDSETSELHQGLRQSSRKKIPRPYLGVPTGTDVGGNLLFETLGFLDILLSVSYFFPVAASLRQGWVILLTLPV